MFSRRLFEEAMDRLRPGWRERAGRRRTLWHLPKVLMIIGLWGVAWGLLFLLVWRFHEIVYPVHSGRLKLFLGQSDNAPATLATLLMIMPLMAPSAGLAMLATNALFWCLAPARRAFEREARGSRGMRFRSAARDLARLTARWLLPVGLGLALIGALIPVALTTPG